MRQILLVILFLLVLKCSAQVQIPLPVGQRIVHDLQLLDQLDTLVRLQDVHIHGLLREVGLKDSVIVLQSQKIGYLEEIGAKSEQETKLAEREGEIKVKRVRKQRNILVVVSGLLIYVVIQQL